MIIVQKRIFLFIFLVAALAEVSIQIFNRQELNLFVKPVIVLSLAAFYFQNSESRNPLFLLALFFCWLGDIFLLFDRLNELYFMGGLGAFLIAHILLIFLYGKLKNPSGNGLNGPQKARVSFPVILAGTGLISILYPSLGALKIPVIIYASALMVMVLQSIYRFGFTTSKSFWNISIGALFFMLSDFATSDQQILSAHRQRGCIGDGHLHGGRLLYLLGCVDARTEDQLTCSRGRVNSNSVY
ncbi:MAG TPA: lysoplasmalogenase [Cyclobacteriaceae bacterium]|nr:lysoplasmalogenase [Cyclobacteriaceae bacterium]